MRALVAALSVAFLGGCDSGTPASPTFQSSGETDASTAASDATAEAEAGFAVCPPGMDASFGSILTQMLATGSCGSNVAGNCHSTSGASATGDGLDYSLDAGAVYAELLGDGGGAPAFNISGSASVKRVVPFDAGASMLYLKLTLKTLQDPSYGAGMPRTAPGSVCPDAVDAVKAWIDNGAKP